jgi:hypothetical protein
VAEGERGSLSRAFKMKMHERGNVSFDALVLSSVLFSLVRFCSYTRQPACIGMTEGYTDIQMDEWLDKRMFR